MTGVCYNKNRIRDRTMRDRPAWTKPESIYLKGFRELVQMGMIYRAPAGKALQKETRPAGSPGFYVTIWSGFSDNDVTLMNICPNSVRERC